MRDWSVAGAVAAIMVAGGWPAPSPGSPVPAVAGWVLLAAGGLALAARRRAPVVVLAVTAGCAAGYQAAGFDVFAVSYLVAVYAAMRAGRRAATAGISVLLLLALPLAAMAAGLREPGEAFARARDVLELAWLIAAAAAGEALRQAERRADEAERTREEVARRRAGEERLHLARELHDSLTHQISVIKLQAEVAVHLARKRGEPVPEALLTIRDAGREAARELRATVEALREETTPQGYGLSDVPGLINRARRAGLDASLTIDGHSGAVPEAVGRAAYRIVQESLTNVARHASAATASVRIGYRPDAVSIVVDDDGTAAPGSAPPPGAGLLGMRERVTALGGRLQAGARDAGGFRVQAELPLDRTR